MKEGGARERAEVERDREERGERREGERIVEGERRERSDGREQGSVCV